MSEYKQRSEEVNQRWSVMLACALAHAEDVPEDAFAHYLDAHTLEVPAMLYSAMLQNVRLGNELVAALQKSEADIDAVRKLVTKIGRINSVLAALPANHFNGVEPKAHELMDAVVMRQNGRWPL
jgi:hypothetical protein